MIFRQLFEPVSSTYTYLVGCDVTGEALLIDPVVNAIERDLAELLRLGLTLTMTVDTHVHADHITSALQLRQRVGSRIAAPAPSRVECADIAVEEGRRTAGGAGRRMTAGVGADDRLYYPYYS